ncbi:MAG: hypothetical protein KTR31_17035 [Myxococcales bacterium]|nr:hypothetical protein [Myxococcales bacterium]
MTNPPIFRNSILTWPVGVAIGAAIGTDYALAAGVSGALCVANIWVLSVLGPRLVSSVAKEEFAGMWLAALGAKFVILAGLLLALVRIFPPLGVGLGFVPLLLGTLITGIGLAQEENAREEAELAAGAPPHPPTPEEA